MNDNFFSRLSVRPSVCLSFSAIDKRRFIRIKPRDNATIKDNAATTPIKRCSSFKRIYRHRGMPRCLFNLTVFCCCFFFWVPIFLAMLLIVIVVVIFAVIRTRHVTCRPNKQNNRTILKYCDQHRRHHHYHPDCGHCLLTTMA